jgi:DNA-binding NarL/FixJ family response regulator
VIKSNPTALRPQAQAARQAVVVIVDDERLLCDLLADRLNTAEADFTCAGTAATPDEARALVSDVQPDIILLDGVDFHSRWPDDRRIDPLKFAAELIDLSPSSYLLIWTHWEDPLASRENEMKLRLRAARAGAEELVLKGAGFDHLLAVMRTTISSGAPPRDHLHSHVFKGLTDLLTGDTDEVIIDADDQLRPIIKQRVPVIARGLETGLKIPEIAETLHLTVDGLRSVVRIVYEEWGVTNQTAFVAEARRRGYL